MLGNSCKIGAGGEKIITTTGCSYVTNTTSFKFTWFSWCMAGAATHPLTMLSMYFSARCGPSSLRLWLEHALNGVEWCRTAPNSQSPRTPPTFHEIFRAGSRGTRVMFTGGAALAVAHEGAAKWPSGCGSPGRPRWGSGRPPRAARAARPSRPRAYSRGRESPPWSNNSLRRCLSIPPLRRSVPRAHTHAYNK